MNGSEIAAAIGLIIVGLVILAFVIKMIVAMVRQPGGPHVRFDPFEPTVFGAGWRTFVFLPGVQSRGDEALMPASWSSTDPDGVMGFLRTHGRVVTATYIREKTFSPNEVIAEITDYVQRELNRGRQVVLIGSSFGGMLAMDVKASIELTMQTRVKCWLVSTPSGSAHLLGGGNILGPVLKWTGLDWLLTPLLRLFRLGAGTISEDAIQEGLDVADVQTSGRARSSGFSWSGLVRQVAYMGRWRYPGRDHPVPDPIHYFSCRDDKVVRQPDAAKELAAVCDRLVIHEVPVHHCEYLGQPRAFIEAFEAIIDE